MMVPATIAVAWIGLIDCLIAVMRRQRYSPAANRGRSARAGGRKGGGVVSTAAPDVRAESRTR
jgi:hypothetical protein